MNDHLPSSYRYVSNNRECLHDKCDHSMSLRLIKRLSHLTSDGEDVMEQTWITNSSSSVLWKWADLSGGCSVADVKDHYFCSVLHCAVSQDPKNTKMLSFICDYNISQTILMAYIHLVKLVEFKCCFQPIHLSVPKSFLQLLLCVKVKLSTISKFCT